jgi:hypothetical protein
MRGYLFRAYEYEHSEKSEPTPQFPWRSEGTMNATDTSRVFNESLGREAVFRRSVCLLDYQKERVT